MAKGNRNPGRRVAEKDKDKPQKPPMVRQELYVKPEQKEALKKLSTETDRPVGDLIRQAIDTLLQING